MASDTAEGGAEHAHAHTARIERTIHVIAVLDLDASARFYEEVLGFEVREIGDLGWRLFVRDECRILAGECPDAPPPRELGDHSYFAYLVVSDARADDASVTAQGAEILKALRDEPWDMREFALRTSDGHRPMIGRDID